MCGIAGIISNDAERITVERLKIMTDSIRHRGPDGELQWINAAGTTGFSHRRLAILDLSAAGAQPMHYLDRYTLLHNGEIYNYQELREILRKKGYHFRSLSDSEVILAAYDLYGADCLEHFDGMFALAIWDEQTQSLFAARDRFGEKPFYYHRSDHELLFGSEPKALFAAGVPRIVKQNELINFLAIGYIANGSQPGESIFEGIAQLPPAHAMLFTPSTGVLKIHRYWQLPDTENKTITEAAAVVQFGELFTSSVRLRLRSDVAIGSCLSGGLDSSAIVGSLASLEPGTLETFSAVFPGFEKDESSFIAAVSRQFNCNNHQVQPEVNDLVSDLEKLIYYQENFISSASIYAQYRVYQLAKQHNTIVLFDGQGADEILGGYSKHIPWALQELYRKNGPEYKPTKAAFGQSAANFTWANKLAAFMPVSTAKYLQRQTLLKIKNSSVLHRDLRANYAGELPGKPVVKRLNDMLKFDTTVYGLPGLLQYADRNAMAHGREVRLPFLSHKLVEFVFSLPVQFKIRSGYTKWLLRKTMDGKLPAAITWRKDKVGFEPPQQAWMHDLKLQERIRNAKETLVSEKIIDPGMLQKKIQPLDAHAADNYDWRILMAELLIRI